MYIEYEKYQRKILKKKKNHGSLLSFSKRRKTCSISQEAPSQKGLTFHFR